MTAQDKPEDRTPETAFDTYLADRLAGDRAWQARQDRIARIMRDASAAAEPRRFGYAALLGIATATAGGVLGWVVGSALRWW